MTSIGERLIAERNQLHLEHAREKKTSEDNLYVKQAEMDELYKKHGEMQRGYLARQKEVLEKIINEPTAFVLKKIGNTKHAMREETFNMILLQLIGETHATIYISSSNGHKHAQVFKNIEEAKQIFQQYQDEPCYWLCPESCYRPPVLEDPFENLKF